MMIRQGRFNINLLLTLALAGLLGCVTTDPEKQKAREESKQLSSLRVHLEQTSGYSPQDPGVPVFRENPALFHIEKRPILTEAYVVKAKLVESMGSFAIQVQLDHQGMFILEQATTANKGKHLLIFSQFGETQDKARWLAAPVIRQRIADGVLTFTPDASREEAERIVRGLNNLYEKEKKKSWFKD